MFEKSLYSHFTVTNWRNPCRINSIYNEILFLILNAASKIAEVYVNVFQCTFFLPSLSPIFFRIHAHLHVYARPRTLRVWLHLVGRAGPVGRKTFVLSYWKGRKVRSGNGRALRANASTTNSSLDLCFWQYIIQWHTHTHTQWCIWKFPKIFLFLFLTIEG